MSSLVLAGIRSTLPCFGRIKEPVSDQSPEACEEGRSGTLSASSSAHAVSWDVKIFDKATIPACAIAVTAALVCGFSAPFFIIYMTTPVVGPILAAVSIGSGVLTLVSGGAGAGGIYVLNKERKAVTRELNITKGLEGEVDALKAENSTLKKTAADLESQVTKLKQAEKELTSAVNDLEVQKNALSREIDTIKEANLKLEGDLKQMDVVTDIAQKETRDLKVASDALTDQLAVLEKEKRDLEEASNRLTGQLDTLTGMLPELEDRKNEALKNAAAMEQNMLKMQREILRRETAIKPDEERLASTRVELEKYEKRMRGEMTTLHEQLIRQQKDLESREEKVQKELDSAQEMLESACRTELKAQAALDDMKRIQEDILDRQAQARALQANG